eukprot:GHRQ01019457.1.p2 GENE.GHRQ01019457.1~~GHRQ01019457.1.p2  ORF type:complete len:118 (+),score=36.16 GHRQ01019457.1:521-874(+)
MSCSRELVTGTGTFRFSHPSTQQHLLVWRDRPKVVMVIKKLGSELLPEFLEVTRSPLHATAAQQQYQDTPLQLCLCLSLCEEQPPQLGARGVAAAGVLWTVSQMRCWQLEALLLGSK